MKIEKPLTSKRNQLVVCMAPAYVLMEWRIMLLGIETWLALGASKIIIPVQSVSNAAFRILKSYEDAGK